ncbi:MAG: secondary thiamine-phosphate synthase enzyme YjbQ, partial [Candidatus Omnitrophota bacterium]
LYRLPASPTGGQRPACIAALAVRPHSSLTSFGTPCPLGLRTCGSGKSLVSFQGETMPVYSETKEIKTKGNNDCVDLTGDVAQVVKKSKIRSGLATVFVSGSTAGVTTVEYAKGAVQDLKDTFDRLIPRSLPYKHPMDWGDDNAHAHLRSALLGPSLTVPVVDGKLQLGTWQQIVLLDFDTHPRSRRYVITMIGE